MIDIKIEMKDLGASEWVDITNLCSGVSLPLRKGFTSLGASHDVSKISFDYKADNLPAAVMFHSNVKQVRVYKDGAYVFEGYAEDSSKIESTALVDLAWVAVNAYPYSKMFENAEAPQDLVFEDMKICDPTDQEHSLLHLFVNAIYDNLPEPYKTILGTTSDRVVTNVMITKVLPFCFIEEGDSILDALTQLMHEYGLAYYMTGLQMYVVEPYSDDETRPVQAYEYSDFYVSPDIKAAPYVIEQRTEVTLGKIIERNDVTVYQLYEDGSVPSENDRIEAGDLYPEDGDLSATYESEEENDDVEICYATGLSYEYTAQTANGVPTTLQVEKAELGAAEALFRFQNNNSDYAYLNQLIVKASNLYLKDTSTVVKDSTLPNARDVNEIETSYLTDVEDCERYIQTYRAEVTAEKCTFTFRSGKISAPEPNTLFTVGDIPTVMLVRYTETDLLTGEVAVYAVTFDVVPIGTTSSVNRPSTSPGISYISLNLSGTSYTYNADGELDPSDQNIIATLSRYGTIESPSWYINGELQDSRELVLSVPPSFMTEGCYFISVRVEVGSLYSELYIYKISQGKDGNNPIYQYCYSDSDTIAPLGAGGLWYMLGLPLFYKDQVLGNLAEETWTDYKPEQPPGKPYLWVRWSADNGSTWSEPICVTGKSASDFSIRPSASTYLMTSRSYVNARQVITFYCDKQNIPDGTVVSWLLTTDDDNITLSSTEGDSVTVTIAIGATAASFSVSCAIEDIGTKNIQINGVTSGEPAPDYQGVIRYPEEAPEMASNGPLVLGDYILYIDANNNEIPRYWTGSSWADVTANTANYGQIMGGVLNDALTQPGAIPSGSYLYLYVGQMAAKAAFFEQLFANDIEVLGTIFGGGYDKDGNNPSGAAGFFMRALDGILRATGAILNGSFECSDALGYILKTYFEQTGNTVECSPKSRWSSNDLLSVLAAGTQGTLTYDGVSYNYKRTNSSNGIDNKTAFVYTDSGRGNGTYTLTPQFPCTVRITVEIATFSPSFYRNYIIAFNGNEIDIGDRYGDGNHTFTYTFNGTTDSLYIIDESRQGTWRNDVTSTILDDALFFGSNINNPDYKIDYYMALSKNLTISGVFDSSSHITLAPITGWITGLTQGSDVMFSGDTRVIIDGTQYTPTTGALTSNSFILVMSTGEQFTFLTAVDQSDFATSGWYDISGDLTFATQRRGVATASLYPSSADAILGLESLPYSAGYIINLFISNLTADGGSIRFENLPTSSSGLPAGSLYRDGNNIKIVI